MLIGIENQAKCFLKREAKKSKHQEKAIITDAYLGRADVGPLPFPP